MTAQLEKSLRNQIMETNFDLFFKKLTNLIMKDGKKIKASKILFKTLIILKQKLKKDLEKNMFLSKSKDLEHNFLEKSTVKSTSQLRNLKTDSLDFLLFSLLSQAVENVTPNLEVRKVRVAGSTYLVPAVLSKKKQETLALKWLLESAQKRQKNSKLDFSTCLADEILDASRKIGQARQKRDELHRLAQTNRAYIRYRWW
uniref:30S ribosomal protein S7 n=1 Tax=Micractinium conductrix TaxID=554055 RepID=A0A2I4S776_9CHLO|nr:30S ribosomal protein S7 [Micractinium conductrix]